MIDTLKERLSRGFGWVLLFIILTLVKQLMVESMMGIPWPGLGASALNLLLIVILYHIIAAMSPNRLRPYGLLGFYSLITLLLYADLVHFRYFQMPISVYSFQLASAVGSVKGSILQLVHFKDLLLAVDLIVLVFLMIKRGNEAHVLNRSQRLRQGALALAGLILLVAVNSGLSIGFHTPERLGILNYHFYDLQQYIGGQASQEEGSLQAYLDKIAKTSQNQKHFGVAAERNVIVIQVESMQNFVLNLEVEGQAITPVMNSMIAGDSLYFPHYYQQLGRGNTSDAEFVSQNSLYPSMHTYSFKEYEGHDLYSLPILLKDRGYETIGFHGNTPDYYNREGMYPQLGIDTFISSAELESDEVISMGISDGSVFRQSLDYLEEMNEPFYSLYVTLTSHGPFKIPQELQALSFEGPIKDTLLADYLQSINYFDRMLGEFIEGLKERGIYDNTIIAIYGDHFGIDIRNDELKAMASELLGKDYDYDEFLKVGLLLHIPGLGKAETYEIAGGQIDFYPTMLNLLGVQSQGLFLMGQDLVNGIEGFVASQTYMIKGSFIDNQTIFEMSRDGVFENSRAWNVHTHEPVDVKSCREGYERALQEINLSNYVLHNNLVREVNEEFERNQMIHYVDIEDYWAKEEIVALFEEDVLKEAVDGRYYPERPILKGELITMLGRAFHWLDNADETGDDEHYAQPYIEAAQAQGLLTKDENRSFEPDEEARFDDLLRWMKKFPQYKEVILNYKTNEKKVIERGVAAKLIYEFTHMEDGLNS
ncbi:LTA synthase family protein [Alkaliphilus crotonatoxidans]